MRYSTFPFLYVMCKDYTYPFFFSDVCPFNFPPINLNFLIQVDWGTSVSTNHNCPFCFQCKKEHKNADR